VEKAQTWLAFGAAMDQNSYQSTRLQTSPAIIHTDLHTKTRHELELIFAQAQLDDGGMGPGRLCRWILERRADGESPTVDELICTQASWTEFNADGIADAFRQLLGMLSNDPAPTLLVLFDNTDEQLETLEDRHNRTELFSMQTEALTRLAVRIPELTVGVAVDEREWKAYIASSPESFTKAVIREHVVPVAGLTVDRIRQMVASTAIGDIGALEPLYDQLAKMGASPELVESLVEASIALRGTPTSAADSWKSEQERFLFELLEHTADLCGLFQLNVDPGFLFGNKPAEVDLACLDLKIAIEIDGYHHFTDLDHYRRDRRKDLELQQHGYLVLRCLAEDVVPQMATILKTIRAVVRSRASRAHT
jgi:hypothetical protein